MPSIMQVMWLEHGYFRCAIEACCAKCFLNCAVIAAVSTGSMTSAHVPIPTYYANLNAPANLSCESNNRQPLTACFWTRIFKGQPEVIKVDKGMKKRQDGVLYCSQDERKVGKCSLYIPSTQADHFGSLSCTLVTLDGQLLTGKVDISDGNS